MVEEKQYAKSQANGVGDFQNGEASGAFSGDLGINPGKKCGYVRVCIKSHDRKGCSEKRGETDKGNFKKMDHKMPGSCFFVGQDKVGLSKRRDFKIRLLLPYQLNQIHNRHHIAPRFSRIKIYYRKHPETVQQPGIGAGHFCNILQVYMRMVNFNIRVQLEIQCIAHGRKSFPLVYSFILGRKMRLAR